jgi:hypothetical protein
VPFLRPSLCSKRLVPAVYKNVVGANKIVHRAYNKKSDLWRVDPSLRVLNTTSYVMTGYERLSRLISTYPELAIYRKFSTLCTKMLLYKQAELQHLENELSIISQIDARNPQKSDYTVSWEAMNNASEQGGDDLQKRKILEIDEKMDKYCQVYS